MGLPMATKLRTPSDFKIESILEENKFTNVFIPCSKKFSKFFVDLGRDLSNFP